MPGLNQAAFQDQPFENDNYEVVGVKSDVEEFLPMEVSVLSSEKSKEIDEMFADFGGRDKSGAPKRWHLPDHMSAQESRKERESEAEQAARIAFTEEELQTLKAEIQQLAQQEAQDQAAAEHAQKLQQAELRIAGVLQDLGKQLSEQLRKIERQAVDLSLVIARKLVDQAVEINPEYIVKVVREALHLAGGASVRKVRVSPQDMEFIEVIGVAKQLKEYDGTWQFIADPAVREGCIVETSAGEIDFELDTAWERIKDSVVRVLR